MHWPFAVLLGIALVLPPFFQNWEIVFLPLTWGGCGHGRRVGSAALSPPVTTGMLLDAGQDALRLAGSVESSARVTFAPGAARRAGATRRLMGARAAERLGTAHLAARCLRSPWRPRRAPATWAELRVPLAARGRSPRARPTQGRPAVASAPADRTPRLCFVADAGPFGWLWGHVLLKAQKPPARRLRLPEVVEVAGSPESRRRRTLSAGRRVKDRARAARNNRWGAGRSPRGSLSHGGDRYTSKRPPV